MFLKFFTVLALISVIKGKNETLKLVHVLFRHGNRTLDPNNDYPNDPHINETFYPFGFGQLTNKGKLREYRLGLALRRRYDTFLGDLYRPELLDAVSTNVKRTKMSLELVLAGLYPPSNTLLSWNDELNWQPIPYNYFGENTHSVLSSAPATCPRYLKLYEEFLASPTGLTIVAQYQPLFKLLSNYTGWNVTTNYQVLILHTILQAQEDFDLELPNWTRSLYPDTLNKAGGEMYVLGTYTNELRQLSAGFLLKKIILDTQAKINTKSNEKKLYLYSGHDGNVAWMLGALNVLYPHQPIYGSYILFEVHEVNNVFGFKIFYENYSGNEPVAIVIPGCGKFCPIERFINLVKDSLPQHSNQCNVDL